jgi:putative ABC transport system permease protein
VHGRTSRGCEIPNLQICSSALTGTTIISVSYSLTTIWYERQRFLPAILAVAFSAVLVSVQAGLVLGLLSMMSIPVDKAIADVWVGYPGIRSVDLGRPIPERWVVRLAAHPEVERAEAAILAFSLWTRPGHTPNTTISEVCTVIGTRLDPESLAASEAIRSNNEMLAQLSEFGTVVVDESELGRLGIQGIGDTADVFGVRARVVGLVKGYKSLGGPYLFCSLETARGLLRYQPGEVTYLVAKTRTREDAAKVAARMSEYPSLNAFTADEFSTHSRMHWLITTKAGITVGFTALLGLLVGAVVTSQTLYAATAASQREFATLRAMGIPRWRLKVSVLVQSWWVGLFGIILAAPIAFLLVELADLMGTSVRLHPLILALAAGVTMSMAIGSGLAALRSFQSVDPAHNIR